MDANLHEALKWLKQGEKDLVSSGNSSKSSDYEWSCFQAQQSAEKVLKSILYAKGYRKILTHSVFDLIREINKFDPSFMDLKKEAKVLDGVYITARYPDSIVGDLIPSEYFEKEDAEECIRCAELICNRVKNSLRT
ncbi:MAG: HEPN domain-containing protein [Euryarchaeota archaeon]|nr:HEPN domain-containing protein [Euryarchaeota archaeon]